MQQHPVVKELVLVGGGHSHALFIRQWAMRPVPGIRLTLISQSVLTPYSGMLPGLIAGHYEVEDVHIDLARVCQWAGIRFYKSTVTALELDARRVILHDRPPVSFDVLSLDTGSTPDLTVKGAAEYSVPVKPVSSFYTRWQQILNRTTQATEQDDYAVGVVGSGAGGFELIMAMHHALSKTGCICHWFLRGQTAIKDRSPRAGRLALKTARNAGVVVHTDFGVVDIAPENGLANRVRLLATDGGQVSLNDIIWCTAAAAPDWPAKAGLALDERGFVATNCYLQSTSHPCVFATGDIGTQLETPSEKAGVYAVRQAPILFKNVLQLLIEGSVAKLHTYRPQTDFLSLMATGGKHAIASRGALVLQGDWVWRWKNRIDTRFMDQFAHLPPMRATKIGFKIPDQLLMGSGLQVSDLDTNAMRCNGCGAKIGDALLDRVMASMQITPVDGVLKGIAEAEDTAQFVTSGCAVVQSVDQLRMMVDDPYIFGKISAYHALSDVFTTDAIPHTAQVLVSLPLAGDAVTGRELSQVMLGVLDALNTQNCALIGGHTAEASDFSVGLVINALQAPSKQASTRETSTTMVGDCLILTKPIGIGVMLAGHMRALAKGLDVHNALDIMQQSNGVAGEIFSRYQSPLLTDVTGFGLLGHLHRLLRKTPWRGAIQLDRVPMLTGAFALTEIGVHSSLWRHNKQMIDVFNGASALPSAWQWLLCDPQTSGGLLGVVPVEHRDAVLAELHAAGYRHASDIGIITDKAEHQITVAID